ncbi:MAG: hypothetical protein ACE5R3_07740 [Nitrosopumilaceae archaeon]
MKKQPTLEKKLADWESAFNSRNDLQNDQALKGLIDGLKTKIVVSPGVA